MIIAAQLAAPEPTGALPIIDESTCDEQCEQYVPDGFLGDFAPSRGLCSSRRFYVARNAVGYDDRFTLIEHSEIRRVQFNGSRWDNAMEVRIRGYEQTSHSNGAATANPVNVTMTLVFDEDSDLLTVLRPNSATETFVRCPATS
jgi:hypothetical protein